MLTILNHLLWNSFEFSVLALIAAILCKTRKCSAPVRHALWLILILKLLAPPVSWQLPCFGKACEGVIRTLDGAAFTGTPPARGGTDAAGRPETLDLAAILSGPQGNDWNEPGEDCPDLPAPEPDGTEPGALPPIGASVSDDAAPASISGAGVPGDALDGPVGAPQRAWSWSGPLFSVWLSGAAAWLCLQIAGILRFNRRIRSAVPAGPDLVLECETIARAMGMRRPPRLLVVDERMSPFVWAFGKPAIYLPAGLCEGGGSALRRSVLAHELAHLRRKDHWTAWLEIIAGSAYWWLPVYWFSRHQMRRAADEAADAWAVWVVDCRKSYAQSMLDVVLFLSLDSNPLPATALGQNAGGRETLKRRMTMVLRDPLCRQLSWPALGFLILLAIFVLPASPTRLGAQDPAPGISDDREIEIDLDPVQPVQATPPVQATQPIQSTPPIQARPPAPAVPALPVLPVGPGAPPALRPGKRPAAISFGGSEAVPAPAAAPSTEARLDKMEETIKLLLNEIRSLRSGSEPELPPTARIGPSNTLTLKGPQAAVGGASLGVRNRDPRRPRAVTPMEGSTDAAPRIEGSAGSDGSAVWEYGTKKYASPPAVAKNRIYNNGAGSPEQASAELLGLSEDQHRLFKKILEEVDRKFQKQVEDLKKARQQEIQAALGKILSAQKE